MLNAYKYDQLNRLKESRSYETGLTSNVWNPTTYGDSYYNAFEYDAMGNILTQKRHKRDGTKIEDLSYVYHTSGGKLVRNRLYHLDDVVGSGVDATDIDDMGTYDADAQDINTLNNYVYDEEGRLVKDVQEKISKIVWRVDGKVKEIQRATGSTKWLKFDYDAMGNRIAKHVYNNTGTTHERSTYYILDAQGNQISTYDHEVVSETAQFNLKERNIFGSSRIGSKQDSLNVLTATLTQNYTQILGTKYYEFSNHLGNVLTVFSDVKIALDADANGAVDGFRVPIRNIADYSPFGVQLDGRTIQGDFYRRGFNGMEKDDDVKGGGNSYDFGARMYDARVGRWWSIDALYYKKANLSNYQAFRNNPIAFIDPDGNDEYIRYKVIDEKTGTTIIFVPKDSKISEKVMTDGKGSKEVHSNNYYDFETTITYRFDKEGELHVSKSYKILYKNGLKDFDLAFGSSNVKSKYQNKSKSDGNAWGLLLDLEGSGGSQPAGITFTTNGGGVEETRQVSLNGAREANIEDLLNTLNALKGTSLGTKSADVLKNITEIVSENKDKNCAENDKFKDNNNSENTDYCDTRSNTCTYRFNGIQYTGRFEMATKKEITSGDTLGGKKPYKNATITPSGKKLNGLPSENGLE